MEEATKKRVVEGFGKVMDAVDDMENKLRAQYAEATGKLRELGKKLTKVDPAEIIIDYAIKALEKAEEMIQRQVTVNKKLELVNKINALNARLDLLDPGVRKKYAASLKKLKSICLGLNQVILNSTVAGVAMADKAIDSEMIKLVENLEKLLDNLTKKGK